MAGARSVRIACFARVLDEAIDAAKETPGTVAGFRAARYHALMLALQGDLEDAGGMIAFSTLVELHTGHVTSLRFTWES